MECPNQVPVGLSNSATGFDMTVITAGSEFEPSSGIEDWGSDTVGNEDFRDLSEGATEELDNKNTFDSSTMYSLKQKASMSSETRDQGLATPKTGPQPGISKPATRAPKNTVKKPKKDEFVELVQAEEMTRQKELDLAKTKAEKDTVRAKIKLAKVDQRRKNWQMHKNGDVRRLKEDNSIWEEGPNNMDLPTTNQLFHHFHMPSHTQVIHPACLISHQLSCQRLSSHTIHMKHKNSIVLPFHNQILFVFVSSPLL